MDNLQRFYLSRLAAANKLALEGKSFDGLEICLELRLMPDLAMYTRALVCITICDLSLIEDFPDKMTFAKEGLRIARELKVRGFPQRQENGPNTKLSQSDSNTIDSVWMEKYTALEEDATSCMDRVEDEQRQYNEMLEDLRDIASASNSGNKEGHKSEEGLEDHVEDSSVTPLDTAQNATTNAGDKEGDKSYVDDDGKRWYYVSDSDDEDFEEDMPPIEGLFTLRTRHMDEEKPESEMSVAINNSHDTSETRNHDPDLDSQPALE